MSQQVPDSHFVTYTSKGVYQWSQQSTTKSIQSKCCLVSNDPSQPISDCFISEDGNYLAVALKQSVQIFRQQTPDNGFSSVTFDLPLNEPKIVNFSPKSTFVAIVTTSTPNDDKNLKVYSLSTGKLFYEMIDKKRNSIQWTSDESIAHRMVGSELYFYEKNDFSKPARKVSQKIASYSLAHNKTSGCTSVAIFVKGTKGAPSSVKVYSYPHLENTIASKNLFKVDSVEIKWNSRGDALLLMAIQDVDTTGKSYYGETALHFLDLKENAFLVSGKKEGSVHSCEWLPNNEGFLAVYGRTPAAITLYNGKGEEAFQFGEAPLNSIYLNPFNNLVAFAGFGNLAGDVHIWNLKTRTKISHFQVSDTTHFNWTSDGLHMVTSTQYARLKVANGFKVWDYLGNLLHTEDCHNEQSVPLFRVLPVGSSAFLQPDIGTNVKGKILSEAPVKKYIPPFLRNKQQQQQAERKQQQLKNKSQDNAAASGISTKEKKIRNLNQKLKQIEELKQKQALLQAEGKQLEKNQLQKIEKEQEIVNELNALKLED